MYSSTAFLPSCSLIAWYRSGRSRGPTAFRPSTSPTGPRLSYGHRAARGLGSLFGLHPFEELGQALERFVGSRFHAGGDHAIAVHHRLEDLVRHELCLVAEWLERSRLERDVTGYAFVLECRDDPLRRHDIVVDAAEAGPPSVGGHMLDPPGAPRPGVELVDLALVPPRAPPPRQLLWVGV